MKREVNLFVAVVLLLLVVSVEGKKKKKKKTSSTSEKCYDNETQTDVDTSDCPHKCCINGDCATDEECKKALKIALIIIGSIAACCCLICAAAGGWYYYSRTSGGSGSKLTFAPDSPLPAQHLDQPLVNVNNNTSEPMGTYPPHASDYPPPASDYPPPASGYPPPASDFSGYPPPPPAGFEGYPPRQAGRGGGIVM